MCVVNWQPITPFFSFPLFFRNFSFQWFFPFFCCKKLHITEYYFSENEEKMQSKRKYWKKKREREKRAEMRCQVGNKNDEERETHFCLFFNITEVTLGNSFKKVKYAKKIRTS